MAATSIVRAKASTYGIYICELWSFSHAGRVGATGRESKYTARMTSGLVSVNGGIPPLLAMYAPVMIS